MSRYIDADALIDFIDVGHSRHPSELCFSEIDVVNLLLHAPTADVAPVVHGRWEWDTADVYECSNCGEKSHVKEVIGQPVWDYCPNCGAKMRCDNEQE